MSESHCNPHVPYHALPLAHDHDPSPPLELTSFQQDMPDRRYFQGNTQFRDSAVSQSTFYTPPSAANSSVYALQSVGSTAEFVAYRDDPQASATTNALFDTFSEEKRSAYPSSRPKSRRTILLFGALAAVIVLLAIALPVYFVFVKSKSNSSGTSSPSTSSVSGGGSIAVVSGGNGSIITTENGTTFTYLNPFGGTWYWDPDDPFNNNAQSNSWTPPLNQTFNFGTDKIFGSVHFASATSHLFFF